MDVFKMYFTKISDYGHISGRKEEGTQIKIQFYVFKPVEFNSQVSPKPNVDFTVHKNVHATVDLMPGRK